ncbi:MAG: hypothetical protein J4F30_02045 [Acidobacteria bacterium]|nr:hypothetical protein [Acidobacteriota bacterium]
MMAFRSAILAGVLLAATAHPTSFQQQSSFEFDAPVGDIMQRVVDRVVDQEERGAELQYESRIVTQVDTLDKEGEVTKTETTLHRRYPLEGELYEELIERDGEPLDARARREERERREDFIREVRERNEDDDPIETNDERQIEVDELLERFEASITGVDTLDGEECWVVEFVPRAGKLPEKTRLDGMLNRSSGRLYVSRSDYGVLFVEFQIQKPTRYFWGLATLRNAAGRLEFERVETDVWLPRRFTFSTNVRILWRTTRRQIVREWVLRDRLDSAAAD